MARVSNKLSAVKVGGIARKGMNHDGAGFIFSEARACGPAASSPMDQCGRPFFARPYQENDAMSRPSDWSKVTRPIPVPNERTKPFWDAARRGALELQRCQSCGHFQHPPYATCTRCVSTDLKFEAVRGAGTIYAYTIMYHTGDKRFAPAVPYASVIVELDDAPGALLAGNLLEAPHTAAKVGGRVEIVFQKLNDEITLPQFRFANLTSAE